MSRPTLDYFQKMIGEHFQRENLIMKEMLEANLSKEEWLQLQNFIREHSHSKFVRQMRRHNN
ncbi:MAG: hypothetical protein QXU32_07455 [Nitrososphaerales archaeon]